MPVTTRHAAQRAPNTCSHCGQAGHNDTDATPCPVRQAEEANARDTSRIQLGAVNPALHNTLRETVGTLAGVSVASGNGDLTTKTGDELTKQ